MAKLEIPSIVVNNTGSSTSMEKSRSSKSRLSKQNEFDEVEEDPPSADTVALAIGENNQADKRNDKENPSKNDKTDSSTLFTLPRQRSHPKVKLLQRSHALRDDTSPPPPDVEVVTSNVLSVTSTNTIVTQTKNSSNKHKLGKQGSSQGSLDGSSPCLSRDSSFEQYSDSTGTDLNQFLVETLHRSQKDRMMLLKIEQELSIFAKDNNRQYYRFPQMGSYQRMLVHRVAAYFGMDHNVDQSGMSVIVNKTKNTRIPEKRFRDQIRDELMPEEPKKSILKRDSSSFEEGKDLKSPERQLSSESRRSKSFEEREEEYEKARARIFNQDSSSSQEGPVDSPVRSHESTHNSSRRSSQEDLRWMTDVRPWSSTDSDSSNRPAKLIITKTCASTESETGLTVSKASQTLLMKAESADNREALNVRSRPLSLPKASSFGGISVLVRGDSMTSTRSATPRLTKADSFSLNTNASNGGPSHQLSPNRASSKIESLVPSSLPETTSLPVTTTVAVTPINATVNTQTSNSVSLPVPNNFSSTSAQVVTTAATTNVQTSSQTMWSNSNTMPTDLGPPNFVQGQTVMWAVSNMESVPPGSVLINPQTGQPYLNPDGSVYRHAPSNSSSASSHTFQTMATQSLHSSLVVPPSAPQPSSMQTLQPSLVQIPSHQVQAPSQGPLPMQAQPPQAPPPPPPLPPPPPAQAAPSQPQMPPVMLYSPLINAPHPPEQRQFSLDGNTVNDLSNQLSGVSFSHLPTDSGASGDGGQMMQPNSAPMNQQGYFVRPAGLVANSQGNVAQMPVYFVPPSVPSAQSQVRVIYPVSFLSSGSQNQQTPQSGPQPPQTLAQVSLQNALNAQSQSQITGQYVQGYPMVGYSQVSNQAGGDNFSLSPCYSLNTPSMGIMSGAPAMPNFYPVPTSMGSGPSANAGNTSSMNSSQAPFMSSNLPMYGPIPSLNPSPALTPGSFSHSQGVYRSSTPPAQSSGTKALGLALNSPYVGYPMFPHTSSAQMQPATPPTPTQSVPGQATIFPAFSQPVLNSAFPIFRPGMQLMMRSSTPPPAAPAPPHNLVQTQYGNSAAPMLTKSFSLPADHRFGKMANEFYVADASGVPLTGHSQDNKNMTISSLPGNTNNVRPPASLFGRGIPLLQGDMRLLGPPLQQQQLAGPVRTLVLPQQRMLARFQPPQGMNSNINRPPKMRKQRSKTGASKLDTAILTAQPSANLPADSSWAHVLEVQSLPEGLKYSEVDRYLEEVTTYGGKLEIHGGDGASDSIVTGKRQVLAVFKSDTEAQSALVNIKTNKFELRLLSSKPPS